MADQIATIPLGALWRRVLLVAPLAAAGWGVWSAARWCLGNEVALWVPHVEGASAGDVARAAARLAPDDPQTHFTLARLAEQSFLPDDLAESLARYERAAGLSPNDFRLWVELGRARGAAGDQGGAEIALRRAIELAPNYPEPRWYLGNLLLRQGRTEEAFAELRRAGDADPAKYRPQVFNMTWGAFGGDMARMLETAGESASARGALADYLIGRGRLDEAAGLWRALDEAGRREQRALGERLRRTFVEARRFHDALSVERELTGGAGGPVPEAGWLSNGGFESGVGPAGRNYFEWQITQAPGAQVNLDAREPHGGAHSLRVAFDSPNTLAFRNVSQLVAVRPQTRYRLEHYVRAEGLKATN
ncbi:MAG: tetratricopeptide repeat protein, partial [Acidobacteria bacterium]|nr:tetratricopeptide repeat protein [Acidobacteriota bacterium]